MGFDHLGFRLYYNISVGLVNFFDMGVDVLIGVGMLGGCEVERKGGHEDGCWKKWFEVGLDVWGSGYWIWGRRLVVWSFEMRLERSTDLLWGDWWLDNCWLESYSSIPPCEGGFQQSNLTTGCYWVFEVLVPVSWACCHAYTSGL